MIIGMTQDPNFGPLVMFGLRKMADGAIRNQPWCRSCRSGAGVKKPKDGEAVDAAVAALEAEQTEALETTPEAAEPATAEGEPAALAVAPDAPAPV